MWRQSGGVGELGLDEQTGPLRLVSVVLQVTSVISYCEIGVLCIFVIFDPGFIKGGGLMMTGDRSNAGPIVRERR